MISKVKPDARPASNLTEVPQQAGIINFVHVTNFFELVASIHNLRIKGLKWQRDQFESIQVSFPLSKKINIRTAPVQPLYQWLTQADHNGIADTEVEWNSSNMPSVPTDKGQHSSVRKHRRSMNA